MAIDVEDLTETEDGLRMIVHRFKVDQEGAGETVGLPYGSNPETCPVLALRDWLEVSGITDGAVFRSVDRHDRLSSRRLSAQSVARVVKRHADAAGQDAAGFAAHSLRSGFATEAFAQGVPEFTVIKHGRWKSGTSMRGYIREGSLLRDNAAAKLGL